MVDEAIKETEEVATRFQAGQVVARTHELKRYK